MYFPRVISIVLLNVLQVSTGKILENNVPVFVITFATQEMLIFRNAKTGEIVVGAEDRVEQCHYAAVVTRLEEELDNELTGGWKVVEVRRLFRNIGPITDNFTFTDGSEISAPVPVVTQYLLPSTSAVQKLLPLP